MRFLHVALLVLVCAATPTGGQVDQSARVAALLDEAAAAKKAGELGAAVRHARAAAQLAPKNRTAVALAVTLLSTQGAVPQALDVYEAHLSAGGVEDRDLLNALGWGELRNLARSGIAEVASTALAELSAAGDTDAASALQTRAADKARGSLDAVRSLARIGDQNAITRLEAEAVGGNDRAALTAVQALGEAGARSAERTLVSLLSSREPYIRAAAADAIGSIGATSAVPMLTPLLQDSSYFVRFSAAAALTKFGNVSGAELVRDALNSDATDARLTAARALKTAGDPAWVAAVLPLLDVQDGVDRLLAADLLLDIEHDHALAVLGDAIESENRNVRQQAARVLGRDTHGHAAVLRRLLRDEDPVVRRHAATALARVRTIAKS